MKIRMSWGRTAAVIASLLVATGEESQGGDFIRLRQTNEEARLQTAVFGYEKDGVRVDLIGAIHLADKRYYEFLNTYFENYDVLLFEMVGGEGIPRGRRIAAAEEDVEEGNLSGLRKLYVSVENALGLAGQAAVIDYTAANFVHADLTLAEFDALQKERGESLLSFMIQSSITAEKPKRDPDTIRLMRRILSGRSDLVKLELMQSMEDADKQIDSMAGENVIIHDRNARCMEVMEREVAAGRKKLGIFYGAAHFPGMEKELLEKGFERVSTKWLTAWRVMKR